MKEEHGVGVRIAVVGIAKEATIGEGEGVFGVETARRAAKHRDESTGGARRRSAPMIGPGDPRGGPCREGFWDWTVES